MMSTILTPALALVCWTLVMWIWMYATRIPAIQKANIDPADFKERSTLDRLPMSARQVADNYNHLHEQPVLFYALVFYTHLAGTTDAVAVGAAWAYVAMRVIHSLFQALVNFVPARFGLFVLATIPLFVLAVRNLLALA
jgi:hypothetical protein